MRVDADIGQDHLRDDVTAPVSTRNRHELAFEFTDRADVRRREQFVAADVAAREQHHRPAGVDLEQPGRRQGQAYVDLSGAGEHRSVDFGRALDELDLTEPFRPQNLLDHVLRREAQNRTLDDAQAGCLGRRLAGPPRGRRSDQTRGGGSPQDVAPPGQFRASHVFNSFLS